MAIGVRQVLQAQRTGSTRTTLMVPALAFFLAGERGIMLPLIPMYMMSLGYSVAAIGMVMAMQGGFQLALRLPGGPISDRFGEQRMLAASFLLSIAASLALVLSGQLAWLMVAQVFVGASRAFSMPAGKSYVSKVDEARKATNLGRFTAAQAASLIIGPALGGVVAASLGFVAAFGTGVAVSLTGLMVVAALPHVDRGTPRSLLSGFTALPMMARSRGLVVPSAVALAISFGVAATISVFIVHLRESGIPASTVGLVFSFWSVGSLVTGLAFGRIHARLGDAGTTMVGLVGFGLLLVTAVTQSSPGSVLILTIGLGAGYGLCNTLYTLLAANSSSREQRGAAISMVGMYWAGGQMVGPLVLGMVAGTTSAGIAAGIAGVVVLMAGLTIPLTLARRRVPLRQ